MITSGGRLAAADFDRIASEFLGALRGAPPVDGVYFALHGAMSADQEDDPEGFLLARARDILGEEVPIVVSLDLHGVLTDRMLEHSDAIVATRRLLDEEGLFVGVSSGAIARVAVRIAGELDEGNVVFLVADDGWKYLSSGIYTRPLEEIENLDSTVWW